MDTVIYSVPHQPGRLGDDSPTVAWLAPDQHTICPGTRRGKLTHAPSTLEEPSWLPRSAASRQVHTGCRRLRDCACFGYIPSRILKCRTFSGGPSDPGSGCLATQLKGEGKCLFCRAVNIAGKL